MNIISLRKLNKSFQHKNQSLKAIDDIHLDIKVGSIFGIIGPSGAGKSTLLRAINLLEAPDSGSVFIDGDDITTQSAKQLRKTRQQMGMIFQHFNLLSSKTVFDNIALPLRLAKQENIEQQVEELLTLTGLSDKRHHYPSQLSGGQKQRVAIARALVYQPQILLCDEATSALDPNTTAEILNLLKDIRHRYGITIVLITHEMQVIKDICDEVAIIDQGKIIEHSAVIEFFQQPQTALGKQLLQTTLRLELPTQVQANLSLTPTANSQQLWRLWFSGHSSIEPLISQLANCFNIKCNILQANLEMIHHHSTGIMLVAIDAAAADISQGKAFLLDKAIRIEELGYVSLPALQQQEVAHA